MTLFFPPNEIIDLNSEYTIIILTNRRLQLFKLENLNHQTTIIKILTKFTEMCVENGLIASLRLELTHCVLVVAGAATKTTPANRKKGRNENLYANL